LTPIVRKLGLIRREGPAKRLRRERISTKRGDEAKIKPPPTTPMTPKLTFAQARPAYEGPKVLLLERIPKGGTKRKYL